MTYNAEELERLFMNCGRIRKSNKNFANDSDYWTGGCCNWGGNHNLKEDCKTLEKAFNKIESLRGIKEELKKCTNKGEYDAKKANYIRKCEELISNLQGQISSSNFMFGICTIWSGKGDKTTDKRLSRAAEEAKKGIEKIKKVLENEDYKWVEELKLLKLEETKINCRMKENKQKAINEKDPAQKALLLQMIEDDGKKLKENLEKQKELSNKFNFDPSKRVNDLIESMKNAIEKSGERGNIPRKSNNPDNSDPETDNNTDNSTNNSNTSENKDSDWFQNNQPLIIFGAIVALLVLYFYYSQEEELNYYDF